MRAPLVRRSRLDHAEARLRRGGRTVARKVAILTWKLEGSRQRNAKLSQDLANAERSARRWQRTAESFQSLATAVTSFRSAEVAPDRYDVRFLILKPAVDDVTAGTKDAIVELVAREIAKKIASGITEATRTLDMSRSERRSHP